MPCPPPRGGGGPPPKPKLGGERPRCSPGGGVLEQRQQCSPVTHPILYPRPGVAVPRRLLPTPGQVTLFAPQSIRVSVTRSVTPTRRGGMGVGGGAGEGGVREQGEGGGPCCPGGGGDHPPAQIGSREGPGNAQPGRP